MIASVRADCIDTVEQFIRNTVSSESQHILFSLSQIVQALLVAKEKIVSDGVSGSFTSTVHHICPAAMVSL